MPDAVVAIQVQVYNIAEVTPQHTGSNRRNHGCGLDATPMWVKALKRQQRIKIHPKKANNNSQESQVIQSSGIQSSEFFFKNKNVAKKLLLKRQRILGRNKEYEIDFCKQLRIILEK